ncbi:hypothetical protein CA13_29180 [Planctomycetes bacterium CA13]|uniref:Glucosylceramidase n=2 Tax=Novipirellula herctigrandis TaxID=2527986 RepID=A0A5C5Z2P6_9BACT|nr:hypothetical protein CA13_29180 [Planctomycetes bacterium CA13]
MAGMNIKQNNCPPNSCGCQLPKNALDLSRREFMVSASALAAGLSTRPLMAAEDRESYATLLKADPSLRGYWRFDGNLVDAMGKAPGKGAVSYVDGVVGGKAIKLIPKQSVTVNQADHLRGKSATVEFFFKLVSSPEGDQHPVLISQTIGQQVRYIVGVKNDLSGLIYQNNVATVQTTIKLPTDQPIEVGRWYHFAMTGFDLDLRAYVDGYECSLTGGAFEFTRRGPKKSPMMFGGTSVRGWGLAEVCLDEVACYASGLAEADFQEHLKAAGWGQRLEETGQIVAHVEGQRNATREAKAQAILNDPALTAKGQTHVYEGEKLEAIQFTVGGIGAGGIQFNGKAQPGIWQIACNYTEEKVADTFLAIRAQAKGGKPVVRALQTEAVGPFAAMPSLKFEGEYPFGKYRFKEPALPVEVELEVFNPFIPMDLKNSAIPCAIYTVTFTNNSAGPVKVDVLAAQKNALGYHESPARAEKGGKPQGPGNYGNNQNRILNNGSATMMHMTRAGDAKSDMVLMTMADGSAGCAAWDSAVTLHSNFSDTGICKGPAESKVSADGKSVNGALTAPLQLAAGETKSVTFVLTWYFQTGQHGNKGKAKVVMEGEGEGRVVGWSHSGQNYTNWWPNAMSVAEFLQDNLAELTTRTRRFHDTLYASNIPVWLLDRMSSQLAVLRSQTVWWAADGYFGAWEGCNPAKGCCEGNCTHVWHYAQAHARLLPELGRMMRDQDYATQLPSGLTPYRHTRQDAAADGHFGTILNTYREHLCSADNEWLKSRWPKIKKAIEWGIEHWNPKRDGFLQTVQHNTLDGAMTGCSSWIGSLYLSSLEAGARMAEAVGESDVAADYRKIRQSGKKLQDQRLWNGEYYVQEVGEQRIQDYLDGCHIDQLLGEWWGDQVGIDRNFPADRSKKALKSLLKYNFLTDFHGQSLKPRQYCESDDGGMKMITWPNKPQPIPGMKYGDEVMTGFEYGAAVSMMQNGLLKEGLMVIKVISDRYNGRLRTEGVSDFDNGPWGYSGNPFGDDECGKFYGRSLSVWSVLLALQGFIYDGPAGRIGFKPRLNPKDHASFFSVAEGYGLYSQVQRSSELQSFIDLREGQLRLTEIVLEVAQPMDPESVKIKLAGNEIGSGFALKGQELQIRLDRPLLVKAGQRLDIKVTTAPDKI